MLHRPFLLLCSSIAGSAMAAAPFSLTSDDVAAQSRVGNAFVYKGYGCNGGNRSPALRWADAPAGTASFAVTVFDPDAPTGHGWWHWLVLDIPPDVTALPTGAGSADGAHLPAGSRQLRNDFGTAAYGGPCPPAGDQPHRYVFTVYALRRARLELPAGVGGAQAEPLIKAAALGQASFTASYGR